MWSKRYAPSRTQDMVLPKGEKLENHVLDWLLAGEIPHRMMLLHGRPGTGKTTFVRCLLNDLGVPDYFRQAIAASDQSKHDIRALRDMLYGDRSFLGNHPMYVIINEIDATSLSFLSGLREIDDLQDELSLRAKDYRGVRFLMTTNHLHKVDAAVGIISRCVCFDFDRLESADIRNHLENVAKQAGKRPNPDAVFELVEKYRPDVRRILDQAYLIF